MRRFGRRLVAAVAGITVLGVVLSTTSANAASPAPRPVCPYRPQPDRGHDGTGAGDAVLAGMEWGAKVVNYRRRPANCGSPPTRTVARD